MKKINRRGFLGGAAAGAGLLALRGGNADAASNLLDARRAKAEPRVAQLIERSRDARGGVHIERAAFVEPGAVTGTLPLEASEVEALRSAMTTGDFATFQMRGVRLGGEKFVFLGDHEDGAVIHVVRRGQFATVRRKGDQLIVATSSDRMVHGRAVEAVYQFAREATHA